MILVLGHAYLGRIGDKAEEPFRVGVGPVHRGVVDVGLEHARFEVDRG